MSGYPHRITLQARAESKDAAGNTVTAWADVWADVPARWLPGPGREFLAAEAVRAETAGRFVIRWLPGVDASMRALWDGQVFALTAPPMSDPTARRELTLMVAAGVADG